MIYKTRSGVEGPFLAVGTLATKLILEALPVIRIEAERQESVEPFLEIPYQIRNVTFSIHT
jgi:hypothetical protein